MAALPGRSAGRYLIEERAVATIPVPRLLPALLSALASPRAAAPAGGLVVVGDVDFGPGGGTPSPDRAVSFPPLPATVVEVNQIVAAWASGKARPPAKVLRGALAGETTVRAEAASAGFLHLATHGFVLPEPAEGAGRAIASPISLLPGARDLSAAEAGQLPQGLRSGLALAGANRGFRPPRPGEAPADDGIWTALEVAGTDLSRADLVVLSACETGLGKAAGGEGVLGLQRAFQVAGARTVVATLWKVDDSATQALMVAFYRNLWEGGKPRLQALRDAQIALLNGKLPAPGAIRGVAGFTPTGPAAAGAGRLPPALWAAFLLSGDWR
jgi:CHAT domain-containing protein